MKAARRYIVLIAGLSILFCTDVQTQADSGAVLVRKYLACINKEVDSQLAAVASGSVASTNIDLASAWKKKCYSTAARIKAELARDMSAADAERSFARIRQEAEKAALRYVLAISVITAAARKQ